MTSPENLAPGEALTRLMRGNARFAADRASRPRATGERRAELEAGQNPYAVILTCGDSRVSPTLLFDQGLGDLFVLRVAGNVEGDSVIASIEYAVVYLGVRLVMVLGHSGCGAVAATVEGQSGGHIEALAGRIRPAVERATHLAGPLIDNAIRENAKGVAERLRHDPPILCEVCASGQVEIVPAYYALKNGAVTLLEEESP